MYTGYNFQYCIIYMHVNVIKKSESQELKMLRLYSSLLLEVSRYVLLVFGLC